MTVLAWIGAPFLIGLAIQMSPNDESFPDRPWRRMNRIRLELICPIVFVSSMGMIGGGAHSMAGGVLLLS